MLKAGNIIPSQIIVKTGPLETIDYESLDGGSGGDEAGASVKFEEPRLNDPSWEPKLVGSCDGLVCLAIHGGFILYNPATKEYRNLFGSHLVLEDDLHDFHGFGYDSASDDYKIVNGDRSTVRIFSLKLGSWSNIEVQQERHRPVRDRGVYWKGALHWWVSNDSGKVSRKEIMSFDLSEKRFRQVLSVPEVGEDTAFDGLEIHGNSLFICPGIWDGRTKAWITDEYRRGGAWTELFSVSIKISADDEGWPVPITYTRSGKFVYRIGSDIIWFNKDDATYSSRPIKRRGKIESAICLEILVSPSFISNL